MASIAFTDGTGAATLQNGRTAPADRFAEWTPGNADIASRRVTLAGVTVSRKFQDLDGVSLAIDKLVSAATLTIANRLIRHLLDGSTCTVTTGDSSSRVYTCRLWPDTSPSIEFTDPKRLRYTFRAQLVNTSAGAMVCEYPLA